MNPITRKETFLAKAGGQSVNTPKPITREEMFLQKIAENGGGGVTSWNDLTDRPDYLNPLIGATSDITPTQVVDAISAGKAVYLTHTSNTYGLINLNAVCYCPSFHAVIGSAVVMYNMEFLAVEVLGYTHDNSWRLYSALLTTQTGLQEEIPE